MISALIVSHGRREVCQAIKSIFEQDLQPTQFEIILVADTKIEELNKYENNPRILIKYSNRKDPGGKWAEAIRLARGQIVCFLDDDDMWVPEKLSYVLSKFQSDQKLGYYHNGHISIDQEGKPLEGFAELRHYYSIKKVHSYFLSPSRKGEIDIQTLFKFGAPFNSSCISMRKEIVEPYLNLLSEGKWLVDYFWLFTYAVSAFSILIEEKPLTLYRRRTHQDREDLRTMQKSIEIYRRYLNAHNVYSKIALNSNILSYFNWVSAKAMLLLEIYGGEKFDKEEHPLLKVLTNMQTASSTGIISTFVLAYAYLISKISKGLSIFLLGSMEKLKLSII